MGPARQLTFETERLRLRTLLPGDEAFLAALDSDPEVMRYIHAGPLSQATALEWAHSQVEMAPNRWHLHKWMVQRREDSQPLGWVELSKFRGVFDPAEKNLSDDIGLGYQFAVTYWNQGFATESIAPILNYAFGRLDVPRVIAAAQLENVRSHRVLEKLGFRRHPKRRYKDEGRHQCFLYSLVKSDWKG